MEEWKICKQQESLSFGSNTICLSLFLSHHRWTKAYPKRDNFSAGIHAAVPQAAHPEGISHLSPCFIAPNGPTFCCAQGKHWHSQLSLCYPSKRPLKEKLMCLLICFLIILLQYFFQNKGVRCQTIWCMVSVFSLETCHSSTWHLHTSSGLYRIFFFVQHSLSICVAAHIPACPFSADNYPVRPFRARQK